MELKQIEEILKSNDPTARVIEKNGQITYISHPKALNQVNKDFLFSRFDYVDSSRFDITFKRRK